MRKSMCIAVWCLSSLGVLGSASSRADGTLTEVEMKWLRAGWPALTYAEQQGLPIDIIVQDDAKANDVPLAMGFAEGRCQLVLSMRSNPDAETILASLPAAQQGTAIEAMVAHEIAHCWRYTHGAWHELPAGFVEMSVDIDATPELAKLRREMRETRREEGFADLVGLAWTLRQHPEQYAQIYAWFKHARDDQPVPGGYHDTRIWIQLAEQPSAFAGATTPFEQANRLWSKGLLDGE